MKSSLRKIALFFGQLWFRNNASKILFYHDLHDKYSYTDMSTALELFKQHISAIKEEGFELVPSITKASNQVSIQFDDGFKGIYDCLPYLIEEQIPIELFVITARIGKEGYLTAEELIALDQSGLVRISAHTHQHIELGHASQEEMRSELMESKKVLEQILGKTVDGICYPRGVFSSVVVSVVESCGFKAQYSSLPGNYFNKPFPSVYRRNLVQYASPTELKYCLRGAHELFAKRYFKRQFVK